MQEVCVKLDAKAKRQDKKKSNGRLFRSRDNCGAEI